MGVSIRSVLAGIPGWEHAATTELRGGLTNRNWLVDNGRDKAVLKIDDEPRSAPYNERLREAEIQGVAAEQGLANRVLYADERALMTEYVEGEVWEPAALADEQNLSQLARALRRLHALPLTGRSFDSRVAARRYLNRIDHADAALVTYCERVVETQRLPHNLCCCHNDLVAANIVATPGVLFLDWEYACDNDPLFDLATIVEHHGLDDVLAGRLLDAYFDGDGERWRSQLESQKTLYAALYWMWLASRPDSTQEDLRCAAGRIAG